MPMKWLAPEALRLHVFTTYSDVWAFGVVMWELFTLGGSPYPDLELTWEGLQTHLDKGYRMEKPSFATQAM